MKTSRAARRISVVVTAALCFTTVAACGVEQDELTDDLQDQASAARTLPERGGSNGRPSPGPELV